MERGQQQRQRQQKQSKAKYRAIATKRTAEQTSNQNCSVNIFAEPKHNRFN